jgi:hypothetical protein
LKQTGNADIEKNPFLSKEKSLVFYFNKAQEAMNRHIFHTKCGKYIYHVAIIDYLTEFNFKKQIESNYKIKFKRRDGTKISAVHPDFYAKRFNDFMKRQVFINEKDNYVLISDDIKIRLFR